MPLSKATVSALGKKAGLKKIERCVIIKTQDSYADALITMLEEAVRQVQSLKKKKIKPIDINTTVKASHYNFVSRFKVEYAFPKT